MEQLFLRDNNDQKYRGPMPDTKSVLCQLAKGLAYVHSKQLIHRDITPGNALIWVGLDESTGREKVLLKWADFGLSKRVNERGTCSLTGDRGTPTWVAPELLDFEGDEYVDWKQQRCTTKSDVFAEGLVFAFFLLHGDHPFGVKYDQIYCNILSGKIVKIQGKICKWKTMFYEYIKYVGQLTIKTR